MGEGNEKKEGEMKEERKKVGGEWRKREVEEERHSGSKSDTIGQARVEKSEEARQTGFSLLGGIPYSNEWEGKGGSRS